MNGSAIPKCGCPVFQEDDYLNSSDEPYEVEVTTKGCRWAGCLYERKVGGSDLFYDHANSDFKPLDVAKITMLRKMSEGENGVVFVARLDKEKNQKALVEKAKQQLLQWVAATIGS